MVKEQPKIPTQQFKSLGRNEVSSKSTNSKKKSFVRVPLSEKKFKQRKSLFNLETPLETNFKEYDFEVNQPVTQSSQH